MTLAVPGRGRPRPPRRRRGEQSVAGIWERRRRGGRRRSRRAGLRPAAACRASTWSSWRPPTRSAAGSAPTRSTASRSTAASRCSTPPTRRCRSRRPRRPRPARVRRRRARPASTVGGHRRQPARRTRAPARRDRPPGRRVRRQGRARACTPACARPCPGAPPQAAATTSAAAEAWRRANIPPDVVDGLLRPFFSGVLLEQDVYHVAAVHRPDDADVRPRPDDGARPRHAADARADRRLDFPTSGSTPGRSRAGDRVESAAGSVSARAVVVATDAWTASALLPGALPEVAGPRGHHRLPRGAGLPGGLTDPAARRRRVPDREHHRAVRRRPGVRPAGRRWSPPRWCTARARRRRTAPPYGGARAG